MYRLAMEPRPQWQKRVEKYGLMFHTLKGVPYWDESAAYHLTPFEVDQLEAAVNTLHEMCLEVVQQVIDERSFGLFLIPPEFEELVVRSWEENQPSIYGRFDLAYDGVSPPRLLEYNADTPTGLVEAAVAQWFWLKDIDSFGDQFNSIHERLIDAWKDLLAQDDRPMHFAAQSGQMEDYVTVEYLRDTAIQAGFETEYLDVEQIGWDAPARRFVDLAGRPIEQLFKLYPWEWIVREDFGKHVLSALSMRWIEPPWKMILSCKSILPLLYERFPESPFLLPSSFEPLPGNYVRKPVHAREGSNVQVVVDGDVQMETDGPYEGPYVYQQLAPLRAHDGNYPIFGGWVVQGVSCGLGIREDNSLITQNTSRFVPHRTIG